MQATVHNHKENKMSVEVKYKTSATATGGRDGRTRTDDGKIDLELAVLRNSAVPEAKASTPCSSSQPVTRPTS